MFKIIPEFWEDANGDGMLYPIFGPAPFFFRLFTIHAAITRKLSTTRPTTMPMATIVPEETLPLLVDVEFAVLFVVDFAVGFSVGKDGKGEELGVPLSDELLGGAGGEIVGE